MKLKPDVIAFFVGLVLFGAGLFWAWPPLGLIGPGVVLMAVSVFDLRSKNEHPDAAA